MQCFIRDLGEFFSGGSGSVLSVLCLPGLSELQVGVYEHVSLFHASVLYSCTLEL